MNSSLQKSILTKHQTRNIPRTYTIGNDTYQHQVNIRYDDQCNNGHNTFSITSDIYKNGGWYMSGCCHDEIISNVPEFAHLVKWHLCSSDGPLYYIQNSLYHARNIPKEQDKWFAYIEDILIKIVNKIERVQLDVKYGVNVRYEPYDNPLAKESSLVFARSSAIWPDAELSDFTEEKLQARLPELMAEFKTTVELLGFTY